MQTRKELIPWVDLIPAKIRIQATPTPTPLVVVPVPEPDPAKTGIVTTLVCCSALGTIAIISTKPFNNAKCYFSVARLELGAVKILNGISITKVASTTDR